MLGRRRCLVSWYPMDKHWNFGTTLGKFAAVVDHTAITFHVVWRMCKVLYNLASVLLHELTYIERRTTWGCIAQEFFLLQNWLHEEDLKTKFTQVFSHTCWKKRWIHILPESISVEWNGFKFSSSSPFSSSTSLTPLTLSLSLYIYISIYI